MSRLRALKTLHSVLEGMATKRFVIEAPQPGAAGEDGISLRPVAGGRIMGVGWEAEGK